MYGEMYPLSYCRPLTTWSSVSNPLLSSTEITPFLPTNFIASAIICPISAEELEIVATDSISLSESTFFELLSNFSATALPALSIPSLKNTGLAPLSTHSNPLWIILCASTVAVVVPSPAKSFVLFATSYTNLAPIFSNLSFNSISLAMVTPSFVISGDP